MHSYLKSNSCSILGRVYWGTGVRQMSRGHHDSGDCSKLVSIETGAFQVVQASGPRPAAKDFTFAAERDCRLAVERFRGPLTGGSLSGVRHCTVSVALSLCVIEPWLAVTVIVVVPVLAVVSRPKLLIIATPVLLEFQFEKIVKISVDPSLNVPFAVN